MILEEDKFGAVPFWFWNGDQQEAEITRQLDLAKEGGWRGMTIHARSGNKTPYLSPRWLELFRHACVEAKKRGLELWIYDEEGFPSGSVGWRLPKKDDKFRQKLLTFRRLPGREAKRAEGVLRFFSLACPETPVAREEITDDMRILAVTRIVNPYPVTDYLSRDAGREFLKMTHHVYERELKEFFGDPVKVIYTDDIGYTFHPGAVLAWNDDLEKTFQSMFGYSITDHLSALIENLPDSPRIRRDYRECCTVMLNTNFVRPMHEWAQKAGLTFSGHLCCDEGPFALLTRISGDPCAFYMEEDIPGIDDFCTFNVSLRFMSEARNTNMDGGKANQVYGFPVTTVCKQASSIASQFKHGQCSAEVLTCVGWGLPVRSQMAQMFFEFVLGINIIVHHDCSYNTGGGTKRDCPASYFFQQPYFAVNSELYRPVKRSLALLSRGRAAADTLVMFPGCAAWEDNCAVPECGPGTDPETEYTCEYAMPETAKTAAFYTDLLQDLNLELLRRHVAFEYGYERILRQYGRVEGRSLRIGDCSYSTVIIPGIDHFPADVRKVLDEYRAHGGRLIRIDRVDDLPGDLAPCVRAHDLSPEVAVGARLADGKTEYFLVNYAQTPRWIRPADAASLDLFDPLSGTLVQRHGHCPEEFILPPLKSCHLLPAGMLENVPASDLRDSIFSPETKTRFRAFDAAEWTIRRTHDNIYLIDRVTDESGKEYVFDSAPVPYKPGTVLTHAFRAETVPASVRLFYEPEICGTPSVNGCPARAVPGPAHPSTQVLAGAVPSAPLRRGANTLEFVMKAEYPEFLYLAGDFGVETDGGTAKITEERPLCFGDLQKQGLPFYWGGIVYETVFELDDPERHLYLEFQNAEGVVELEINGFRAGVLYGAPWSFPLAGHLAKGRNTLKLILRNTAQNFFGPVRDGRLEKLARWRPKRTPGMRAMDYSTASFGISDVPVLREVPPR